MPKLVSFLPCITSITSNKNQLSLINILESLTMSIEEDDDVSAITHGPFSWEIVTIWQRETDEENKKFQQKIDINTPDRLYGVAETDFEMTHNFGRTIAQVSTFPLTEGVVKLTLSLREVGSPDWEQISEFPIITVLKRIP